MPTEVVHAYRKNLEDLEGIVDSLAPEDEERRVPATPEWSVRQVLAHLDGSTSDMLAGRMDDAPSPAWTARHVAEREGMSARALFDRLRGQTADIEGIFGDDRDPAPLWDMSVHVCDLREALGRPRAPREQWALVLEVAAGRWLPEGTDTQADDYEIFRVLFSRRSRRQVRSWGPAGEKEIVGVFGPRDDDQPLPRDDLS